MAMVMIMVMVVVMVTLPQHHQVKNAPAVPGFLPPPGVSIIFKIRVFYKACFEGFEFFIVWPYAVFHKMQIIFYKSAHFMYL